MNTYVDTSPAVQAELAVLSSVSRNLLDVQIHRPTMGLVQEQLLGATLVTRRNVFLERADFCQLVAFAEGWNGILPRPAILRPRPLWTGKQLLSCILPKYVLRTATDPRSSGRNGTGSSC